MDRESNSRAEGECFIVIRIENTIDSNFTLSYNPDTALCLMG